MEKLDTCIAFFIVMTLLSLGSVCTYSKQRIEEASMGKQDVMIEYDYIENDEQKSESEENIFEDELFNDVEEEVQYQCLLKSKVNSLNVRSGPGGSYSSLGTLDNGDCVLVVDKVGLWCKIKYYGTVGYVHSTYVEDYYFEKESTLIEAVIELGEELLGYPYVYGAARYLYGNRNINSSFVMGQFDCSSLMQYMFYKGAGVKLLLTTRDQVLQGVEIDKTNIQRGDLLFFTNSSRVNNVGIERVGHVALYLGDNYILHTASDHAVIEQITAQRWSYYITARRMI